MPSSLTARGLSGQVRYGYKVVAELGRWTLSADRVEAHASSVNTIWLDQAPSVSLRLQLGNRFWEWKTVEVLDRGQPFTVRVHGAPELRG